VRSFHGVEVGGERPSDRGIFQPDRTPSFSACPPAHPYPAGVLMVDFMRRFLRDDRGVSLFFAAFSLLPLLAVSGLCMDAGRAWLVRDRLNVAVQSAAAMGAAYYESGNRATRIEEIFHLNFSDASFGIRDTTLTVSDDAGARTIRVEAATVMDSIIMQVFGIEWVQIRSSGSAQADSDPDTRTYSRLL